MAPLSPEDATARARELISFREAEKTALDKIHQYARGKQPAIVVPRGSPREVTALAKISRVNVMGIVISCLAQALYVDGFRGAKDPEDAPAWEIWQANKLDAGQIGIHRSALTYGASYATVLPGDPLPVVRGYSPRFMTALYGDDPDWPRFALRTDPALKELRLYDEEAIYRFKETTRGGDVEFLGLDTHDAGRVPVVRFLNNQDLDDDNPGEIEPLMELQDQIDLTTFSLLVAQHYGAFRQRYAIGWVAKSETELMKVSASKFLTFEDDPDSVKVGEFEQTELSGYIESRQESIKEIASIAQIPAHELIGSLINLSAEALVAAEAAQRRKIVERQVSFGESWEQVLSLAASLASQQISDGAEVRWRDTESRALSATVDALGKMASLLGIPPAELWDRLPNVSQQDIERWRAAAEEADAQGNLQAMLEAQLSGDTQPGARPPGARPRRGNPPAPTPIKAAGAA